jgi:asparagine synthase (glutamine-hydrolysing)
MDIYAVLTEPQKRALYSEEFWAQRDTAAPGSRVAALLSERPGRDPLDQMMYVDLRLWLPDDLLLVADKMSMAESVEARVPFLDPALVAFTESLPSSYKLRFGRRKAVEKAALGPLLPKSIIHRRERGFATPIGDWLRTSMNRFAQEVLLDRDARCAGLFRRSALEEMLRRHAAHEFDHTRQIFCLLSVELWTRRFLAVSDEQSNGADDRYRRAQTQPSASLQAPH